jgi:DNA-3-methyladenine glycosylase
MERCSPKNPDRGVLPSGRILGAEFFARPSDEVAPDLIGKILWSAGIGGGRLTEVEAYLPEGDPACHAARGRTPRNAAMFGPPGRIYVYRSYGVHICLNFVCDRESVGSAILIRSFEPMGDTECMRRNRAVDSRGAHQMPAQDGGGFRDYRDIACGPGRIGQALRLHLGLNGLPLGKLSGLYVIDDGDQPLVVRTTRVGIAKGERLLLGYYMDGSRYISRVPRTIGDDSR